MSSLARPLSEEAGWQFTLSMNAGFSSSQSQFNTNDDNAITADLDNSGQHQSRAMGYPFGRIQYTFDSLKTQFYLGNTREQITTAQFQYELGMQHQFPDDSQLTVAFIPTLSFLNDTWADPFIIGSERETTKTNTMGGRIAVKQLLGSPLTLKYAIASSRIEDEHSGESWLTAPHELALLKRDSLYQRVEVETMFPIASGLFLKPTLQYTHRNADGEANSYAQYTGQLGVLVFADKHFFITTINAGVRNFQQKNPIFSAKQTIQHAGVFSIYTYQKPFGWEAWSWMMMVGYNHEKSDIAFYDKQGGIISTGLTFKY